MDHLLRRHAPISDSGWELLDGEATQRLTVALGARRLIDFSGPHGWTYSATNLGRTDPIAETPVGGVRAVRRRVLPLAEVRAPFSIDRAELANNDRGAADVDLDSLDVAALEIATAENMAVFHGWKGAGVTGIAESSPHPPVPRVEDFNDYPKRVAKAVATLRQSGISGPYGLALGPDDYTAVMETTEHGGYPLFDHVRKILADGPIVWAPGVRGAVVVSLRGGDFLFESGQDLSLGYHHHDAESVHLYLEQSFSFRVATPEAAIVLAAE
ncbi:MAG: bacteriocin family protein [Actinomycetota bacterium]|nr:bacteriocin family protein [Actinomycetota bacterium]